MLFCFKFYERFLKHINFSQSRFCTFWIFTYKCKYFYNKIFKNILKTLWHFIIFKIYMYCITICLLHFADLSVSIFSVFFQFSFFSKMFIFHFSHFFNSLYQKNKQNLKFVLNEIYLGKWINFVRFFSILYGKLAYATRSLNTQQLK